MMEPRATIQGLLSQGVSRTSLERVFVARSQPRGRGVAISILASCPVDAAPPRPVIRSVRWAARSATVCARTLLLTARYNGRRPDRSDMLFAVPVIPEGEQPRGALVALGSAARAGGETIDSLERLARQLAARLSPTQSPALAVARPPAQPDGGAAWPGGAAYDVLLHELRAPLGAAGNALDAAVRTYDRTAGADAAQIAAMLQVAHLGVTEAQSLVRRFSQLRTIANGAAQPTLRAVSVLATLERAVALLQTKRVRIVATADVPPVAANQLWLTHTLTNLIENALKYSRPPDLVQVMVRCMSADRVCIAVIDAGCGIPPDRQQAVFRPYVGGARSADLTSQGLGLGIARYCVTAMGGDLWVESDGHSGATLSCTLPVASPEGS